MAMISVRSLSDEVVRDLRLRAERNNRSLEGEVCHILEDAARDNRAEDDMAAKGAEFLQHTAELRRGMSRLQTPSEHIIREDRDQLH